VERRVEPGWLTAAVNRPVKLQDLLIVLFVGLPIALLSQERWARRSIGGHVIQVLAAVLTLLMWGAYLMRSRRLAREPSLLANLATGRVGALMSPKAAFDLCLSAVNRLEGWSVERSDQAKMEVFASVAPSSNSKGEAVRIWITPSGTERCEVAIESWSVNQRTVVDWGRNPRHVQQLLAVFRESGSQPFVI
jgi:hypothetical protein